MRLKKINFIFIVLFFGFFFESRTAIAVKNNTISFVVWVQVVSIAAGDFGKTQCPDIQNADVRTVTVHKVDKEAAKKRLCCHAILDDSVARYCIEGTSLDTRCNHFFNSKSTQNTSVCTFCERDKESATELKCQLNPESKIAVRTFNKCQSYLNIKYKKCDPRGNKKQNKPPKKTIVNYKSRR